MDYRALLKEDFQSRQEANERYSTRQFAQDLGVSPAYISLILNGKRSLAEDRAQNIASKLSWPEEKKKYFTSLVRLEHAKCDVAKAAIQEEIDRLTSSKSGFNPLKVDTFRFISKWYHSAIMELTKVEGFEPNPVWIAKHLGVSAVEAELALDRLIRMGFLSREQDGSLTNKQGKLAVEEVSSKAIRQYHQGMIELASKALAEQSLEERDFAGLTLSIDKKKFPEAKVMIKEFVKSLCDFLSVGKKDSVYQIQYQMFRLDKPPKRMN